MQRRVWVLFAAIVTGSIGSVHSQDFTITTSQVEISVAPPFNHTPVRVEVVTNAPGVNLGNLLVASDAGWVTPSVDAAASKIVLSFVTSNLINSVYTATITASLGAQTNAFFVKAYVSPLNIFKLKDDPFRSRTYGIQLNGLALGSVVVLDPVTTNYIGSVTVGKRPTDLAESADGQDLFVINCVDETISVVDLDTLVVKQTLTLPAFDNWGQSDTTANIAVGDGDIIYYTDGAWAPVLRVLNRSTMQVLQTVSIDGNGFGDIGVTSDKSLLFGWAQYGWSAGWAGSYIAKFSIAADGQLNFVQETASQYPTVIGRDPLETPVLISGNDKTVFIKQLAVSADNVTDTQHSFPSPVYSISPGGEVAATDSAIYETKTGIKLADLPRSAPVQTISSDYARLIYFDSSTHAIKVLNLLDLIGPGVLNREIVPADGSITLSPPNLEWTPLPGVDRYHIYLGQSQTGIANADTNSVLFLGEVNQPSIALAGTLTPGITYFWRVDAVTDFGITKGDVCQFTVSLISSSINEISAATVRGHADFKTSFDIDSQSPGQPWQVGADQPWVSFTQSNGSTPYTIEVHLNASQLTTGLHQANVTISNVSGALFSIPVSFQVEPLKLTVIRSDPLSPYVYAISEDTTATPDRAYLLEINSDTEAIERVVFVGSSATDLAIHNGDNRLYVPNWQTGSLLAINKSTFELDRAYAFSPFGGVGYSVGDIYRVAAGGPGRLVWEEEDQWINISIFDTAAGTNFASAFVREGGGAFGGNGRYYYHGDNNSSGAAIHKFDVLGDHFSELASIRVSSVSYYGSRTVVVSEDGSRVFWNGSAFDADLVEQWTIADEIFSTSADGHYAFSQTKVYDTVLKQAVLGMPVTTAVSSFDSTTHKLVVQAGSSLAFFTITDPLSLPAPVLSATVTNYNSVTLNWTDYSLESSFTLQRRVAGAATWDDIGTLGANVVQCTVGGLSPLTTYDFRIKADASTVSSAWSDILTVTTPATPPTTPALNVPVAAVGSVALSWSNPSFENSIILERSIGSADNWSVLISLPADTTGYTDFDVISLTNYFYRVKSRNAAGDSAYSVVRSVTVPAPQPPSAPTGLSAKSLSSSTILVTWGDVADETGYRLERRTEDPASWTMVVELPANTTSYTDSNLVQGVQYWYRVRAFNDIGNSPYSNEDDAVPANIVNLIADDFDPNLDPAVWFSITGAMATNGGQGFRGSKALYFSAAGTRSATTVAVDISTGGNIEFLLRAGNEAADGTTLWNNSESGENVVLEYSKDGINWNLIQSINSIYPALSNWVSFSVSIPAVAFGPNTQFRWRQLANSGPAFDCWALEDIAIVGVAPAPPDAVPFVISSASSSTSIAVYWVGSAGAANYVVERKAGANPWSPLITVPSSITYYTDNALMPGSPYSYRIQAVNAGGVALYSPPTTTYTWSQIEQWANDNYGDPEAMNGGAITTPLPDDSLPLLRYAFNLTTDEPHHLLQPGGSNGYPAIWLDNTRDRLCVEFVRRKSSANPGINYQVQFCSDLATWTSTGTMVSNIPIDSVWERVRYEDTMTIGQGSPRFARVAVSPQ